MRVASETDIEKGVRHLVKVCPQMKAMRRQCGTIPLRLSTPDFEGLASIIVSQQVSKASATAIFGRLKEQVRPLTPEVFMHAGERAWIAAGLSRPKQRTLAAISAAVLDEGLDLGGLCDAAPEEAMERLVAIKGIGPWTAEVYLMFCAGHRDIFPAGDLALQEAIRLGFEMDERPDDKAARAIAERWMPWRSVAARILWDYYGTLKRDAAPV
jgi:DNA-3-methyladenine glycosylase II